MKLFVLDLDGTLTDSEKKLAEANRTALMQAQQRGIKVALASGRPTYGIRHLAEQLRLADFGGYIMAYNGGRVIDCATGKVVAEKTIDCKKLTDLRKAAQELGAAIITYDDAADTILSEVAGNKWIEHEAWLNNQMRLDIVPDISAVAPATLPKCLMVGEPDHMAKVEPEMQKRFPELSIYRSSPFFLEIVPKGVDKAQSIDDLRNAMGISVGEIAAFGDGYNDISMVKYAGVGIAMSNGCDEIKAVADFVSVSNDESGVAYAIDKLGFLK